MSSELEAGPELDAAVAKAIGWTPTLVGSNTRPGIFCVIGDATVPRRLWGVFAPSTSLDAAFEAAEEVFLFDGLYLSFAQHGYAIYESGSWEEEYAHGILPTLAICRAILKLKGEA